MRIKISTEAGQVLWEREPTKTTWPAPGAGANVHFTLDKEDRALLQFLLDSGQDVIITVTDVEFLPRA